MLKRNQIKKIKAEQNPSQGKGLNEDLAKKLEEANNKEIQLMVDYGRNKISLNDFAIKSSEIEKERLDIGIKLYEAKTGQKVSKP